MRNKGLSLLSNRVKLTPATSADSNRYTWLDLKNAEPSAGVPVTHSSQRGLFGSDVNGTRQWFYADAGLSVDTSTGQITVDEDTVYIDTALFTNSTSDNLHDVLYDLDQNLQELGDNTLSTVATDDTILGAGTTGSPLSIGQSVFFTSKPEFAGLAITPNTINISGITLADPVVVTTTGAHGLSDGLLVTIEDVSGTTELNGNNYYVDVLSTSTVALYSDQSLSTSVDGTAYTSYTSSGKVLSGGYRFPEADGADGTYLKTNAYGLLEFDRPVAYGTSQPTNPDTGDLWFDSTGGSQDLYVYDGSGWISATQGGINGAFIVRNFLGDGSTTQFTTGSSSATVLVYLNGLLLKEGATTDFTFSGGVVTFNTAPQNNDEITVLLTGNGGQVGLSILGIDNHDLITVDASGNVTFQGTLDMGTYNIINMADPVNNQDAATKAYVDSVAGSSSLTAAGDTGGNLTVDLDSQTFTIAGTANEIETTGSGQTITVGLPNDVTITQNLTVGGYLAGPASFTIDPAAVGDNTGTVIIAGNLQVDGTTTTINSTTLDVDDLNITIASGAADATAANGAGITVDGASATITYDSTDDTWDFNKGIEVPAADGIDFGTDATLAWDSTHSTLDLTYSNGVTLEIGQENHFYAKATGAIAKGELVMFAGAQGSHLLIQKADPSATGFIPEWIIGVADQAFALNDFGYVVAFGKVEGINTSAYTLGDLLYMDGTTAGALTDTAPSFPSHEILVAAVTNVHTTQGSIFVRPTHRASVDELQNVNITSIADNDLLTWDNANSEWVNSASVTVDNIYSRQYPTNSFLDFDDDPTFNGNNATTLASIAGMNFIFDTNNNDSNGISFASGDQSIDSATVHMYLTSTGNLGIGTTAPAHLLHVYGNDSVNPVISKIQNAGTAQARLDIQNSEGNFSLISNGGAFTIYDNTDTSQRFNISTSGAITFNNEFTFPTADGAQDQVLITDGAGTLSWGSLSGTIDWNVSSNYAFSTVVAGATSLVADSNNDTLTVTAGTDISVTGNASTDTMTITNTSTLQTVTDRGNTTTNSVGIGTTDTSSKLVVQNNVDTSTDWYTNSQATLRVRNSHSTGAAILKLEDVTSRIVYGGADAADKLIFSSRHSGNATTESIVMDNNGNLGIGTTSPTDPLTVYKSTTGNLAQFRYTGGTNLPRLEIDAQSDTLLRIDTSASSTVPELAFGTGGTTRMTIDANGNVGIGTTNNINNPLTVYHATTNNVLNLESGDTSTWVQFKDNTTVTAPQVGAEGDDLKLRTSATNRVTIKSDGNVGIGTGDPEYILDIQGVSPVFRIADNQVANTANAAAIWMGENGPSEIRGAGIIYNGSQNTLNLVTTNNGTLTSDDPYNASYRLSIKETNGYVGINTTNPSTMLHLQDSGDPTITLEDTSSDNQVRISHKTTNYQWVTGLHGGENAYKISESSGFGTNDYFTVKGSSGHVGVGTATPSLKFDVWDTSATPAVIHGTSSAGTVYTQFVNTATAANGNGVGLELRANSSTQERQLLFIESEWTDSTDATRNALTRFYSVDAGASVLPLALRGKKVGIGTSDPARSLSVYAAGEIVHTRLETSQSYGLLRMLDSNTTNENVAPAIGTYGDDLALITSATNRIYITSTGDVGIGTSSPSANLDLYDASTSVFRQTVTNVNREQILTEKTITNTNASTFPIQFAFTASTSTSIAGKIRIVSRNAYDGVNSTQFAEVPFVAYQTNTNTVAIDLGGQEIFGTGTQNVTNFTTATTTNRADVVVNYPAIAGNKYYTVTIDLIQALGEVTVTI